MIEGGEVVELGGGARGVTNNQMELTAAIRALEEITGRPGDVEVVTDSTYLIQGITGWVHGWKARGWQTREGGDVANRDLWETLLALVSRPERHGKMRWTHVRGHSGHPANDRADAIAVAFTKGSHPSLFRGPAEEYGVDLDAPISSAASGSSSKSRSKAAAYSYLSLLDGVLKRHKTWADCEHRVKGRAGARFRKTISAEDERAVIRSWGLSPDKFDSE